MAESGDNVRFQLLVRLGGLDSTTKEHLAWFDSELRVGDEVTVRILPPGDFDMPAKRHRSQGGG